MGEIRVRRTGALVSPRSRRRTRRRWLSDKTLTIWAFLLPPIAIYVWLVLLPVAQSAIFSLYSWNGLGPLTNFIGLGNYVRLWNDLAFHGSVFNTALIAAAAAFIEIPMALGLALLLRRKFRGRNLFRAIYFLPFVLSEVIAGIVWTFLYRLDGLVNATIGAVVPGYTPVSWLGDGDTVMIAICWTVVWKYFGIYLILFTAALQNIPEEVEEAARVDGATPWQMLRYVTLPLVGQTTRLTIFMTVLGAIQLFDLVWIMTQGGPLVATSGGPMGGSETMGTQLYKTAFRAFDLGYGSAMAIVLFGVCIAFSVLYQPALRYDPTKGKTR